ncbi:MAG TPA: DUF1513 domain-containing protein [Steroidobacteraceae bacterium]
MSSFSTVGLGAAGFAALFSRSAHSGTLLGAFEDERGTQYVGGLHLESREVFGARVPMRAHGCTIDPRDPMRVVYFARRPGTQAFEFDRTTNRVRLACETTSERHFAGHGLFSPDGVWLLTPEHDFERARGVVAVRDARTFAISHEIDTHGIDPHEIAWSTDGTRLFVANGGILTHPRSYRRKLNIPTMDPSFVVLDARSGARLEQWRLPDHLLSIRHLAVASDGRVAVGLQYEGKPEHAPTVAALYLPDKGLRQLPLPPEQRAQLRGYVASIALSERADLIAAACPYGRGVACWSLAEKTFAGFIAAAETYGVSRLADGSIAASQRDGTLYTLTDARSRSRFVTVDRKSPIRWDDHWIAG